MHTIVLFVLLTAFLCTPVQASDRALLQAMEAYALMRFSLVPGLPNEDCAGELKRVLLEIARMPPVSKVSKAQNEAILTKLRVGHCVGPHFSVYSKKQSFEYLEKGCVEAPLTLKNSDGVQTLRISSMDSYSGEMLSVEKCRGLRAKFSDFVIKLRLEDHFNTLDVLDLRDEPGGTAEVLWDLVTGLFFPHEWGAVLRIESFYGPIKETATVSAKRRGVFGCPRTVLVNRRTASAGEIMTDAIINLCPPPHTVVIGQQTHGKAVGTPLVEIGGFVIWGMATSRYVSLTGRLVDGIGITPDIITKPGEEMAAALQYLKDHPRTAAAP